MPFNADFEGGFAVELEGVAANVTRAVRTGLAGLSIEDSTGDSKNPLFDFPLAVERMKAARKAIDDSGTGVLLTGRSEEFFAGRPDDVFLRCVDYLLEHHQSYLGTSPFPPLDSDEKGGGS